MHIHTYVCIYIFKFSFEKSNSQNFHGCKGERVEKRTGREVGAGIQGEGVGIHGDSRGFTSIHKLELQCMAVVWPSSLWRWRRRAVKRGRGEKRRNGRRSGSERREARGEEETFKFVQCFQHTQRHLDQCFFSIDTTSITRLSKGVFLTKINSKLLPSFVTNTNQTRGWLPSSTRMLSDTANFCTNVRD